MTNLLYSGDDEYTYFGPTETAPLLGLEGKVYDCHATQTQRIAELEAELAERVTQVTTFLAQASELRQWLNEADAHIERLVVENMELRKQVRP